MPTNINEQDVKHFEECDEDQEQQEVFFLRNCDFYLVIIAIMFFFSGTKALTFACYQN